MLSITINGQGSLEQTLAALKSAIQIPKILDEAGAILLARIRARFLSETAPVGGKWKPSLAAQLRATAGRGGGTLYDTGRLFNSIQLYALGEDSRAIGSDVFYGAFHQTGTRYMVARVFLGFNDEDARVVEGYLVKRIGDALS